MSEYKTWLPEQGEYKFRDFYIPERMMCGITRWVEDAIYPGHFLTAILSNDLAEAVGRADDENMQNIPAYMGYLYNMVPSACHGSVEKMKAWKGLNRATLNATTAVSDANDS